MQATRFVVSLNLSEGNATHSTPVHRMFRNFFKCSFFLIVEFCLLITYSYIALVVCILAFVCIMKLLMKIDMFMVMSMICF